MDIVFNVDVAQPLPAFMHLSTIVLTLRLPTYRSFLSPFSHPTWLQCFHSVLKSLIALTAFTWVLLMLLLLLGKKWNYQQQKSLPWLNETTSAMWRGWLNVISWIDIVFSITCEYSSASDIIFGVPWVQNTWRIWKHTVTFSQLHLLIPQCHLHKPEKHFLLIYLLLLLHNNRCLLRKTTKLPASELVFTDS